MGDEGAGDDGWWVTQFPDWFKVSWLDQAGSCGAAASGSWQRAAGRGAAGSGTCAVPTPAASAGEGLRGCQWLPLGWLVQKSRKSG